MLAALAIPFTGTAHAGTDPGEPVYGHAVPPLGATALAPAVHGKKVLVVGDSWAGSFANGMQETAGEHSTIVNGGLGGCGILLPTSEGTPPACREWPRKWPSYMRDRPDAVVLMVAHWDASPQQIEPGAPAGNLGQPAYRKVFEHRLDQALTILTTGSTPVYLVNSRMVGHKGWGAWAPAMNEILRTAATAWAGRGVHLLDLRGQLCNDDGCPEVLDGVDVYDETVHLTVPARGRIARWILNTMFT
ncbi:DUF459 domain-containing protein [Actinocorallia lasiicapitis]